MKNVLLILFLGISFIASGQLLEDVTFKEKAHDFGKIEEVNGSVEHTFTFKNTSGKVLKILNVKASCGCTTPGWSKEEIGVGEEGYVKAKYDPRNRPGPFDKSLTVTTDAKNPQYLLFIKGDVNPKPKTVEDDFPTVMGGIRVKYRAFNMGKVLNHQPVSSSFDIYNASESSIEFLDSTEAPSYIKVIVEPAILEKGEKGKIFITYDPKEKNDLGFMSDNIVLFTNESADNRKSFSVYANIEEYFPPMTEEELEMAPKLMIENRTHNFGRIKQGSVVETTFTIMNEGKIIFDWA